MYKDFSFLLLTENQDQFEEERGLGEFPRRPVRENSGRAEDRKQHSEKEKHCLSPRE